MVLETVDCNLSLTDCFFFSFFALPFFIFVYSLVPFSHIEPFVSRFRAITLLSTEPLVYFSVNNAFAIKESKENRMRHFSDFCRCLKAWEAMSLKVSSNVWLTRSRVQLLYA